MAIYSQIDENEKAAAGVSSSELPMALAGGKAASASGRASAEIAGAINRAHYLNEPQSGGLMIAKLDRQLDNVVMLVVSDSTGNETFEFVYQTAQALATRYPAYTVLYYLWDDVAGNYAAAESLQSGSNGLTLSIYNGAIPGSRPDYLMGSKFANAIAAVPKADLVIFNHGHNIGGSADWNTTNPLDGRAPYIYAAAYQVLAIHDSAGLIFNGQNPKRDDDFNRPPQAAIIAAARILGADVTDSYSRFEAAGKPAGAYADNTHPNATGHDDYIVPALLDKLVSSTPKMPNQLRRVHDNLLDDADFGSFAAWTSVNATITADKTNYESAGQSCNVIEISPGSSRIEQRIDTAKLPRLIGKRVTLCVRLRVPDGDPSSAGRIIIQSDSVQTNSRLTDTGQGGFVWRSVSLVVPAGATFLKAILYGDSASTGGQASFDRAILVEGEGLFDIPL